MVADKIKKIEPETMVIIITGNVRDTESAISAVWLDAFAYIQESSGDTRKQLTNAIEQAFEHYERAAERRKATEQQKVAIQELETKKDMLSFFTHTMRNTFAGAPAAVDQAILLSRGLASKLDNPGVYKIVSNLAFLQTAFQTVDSMLDAYKILVRDPENLRASWKEDIEGEFPIGQLLEDGLRAILGRLFFQDSQALTFDRLTGGGVANRKHLKQSFMRKALLAENPMPPTAWLAREFGAIEIHGTAPRILLSRGGIRHSLLYAVIPS